MKLWNLAQTQINMEIGLVNIKELVNCFHFQVIPLEKFDDYITLHNISMLHMFVVTLYLMHCSYYRTTSKNSALLIIQHPDWKKSLIIQQRSSCAYAIYGNRMCLWMECWILTSKNSAKLKQYYYFNFEFIEEVQ